MPGIILNNGGYAGGGTTPLFNDWLLNPSSISLVYTQGGAPLAPVTVVTRFKDVIGSIAGSGFSNFKYRCYLSGSLSSISPPVVMSGPLYTGSLAFNTYQNGLQEDMVYSFQNLEQLPVGTYTYTAKHQIWATSLSGQNVLHSEKTLTVTITVVAAGTVGFSPSPINITWTIGQPQLLASSQPLQITGDAWTMQAPAGFLFPDIPGTTLLQPNEWGGTTMSGSGTVNFALFCAGGIIPEEITQNPLTFTLSINNGETEVPILVTIVTENGLYLEHDSLHFIAYKNISDAFPQTVMAYYQGNYDFVMPPWLQVSPQTVTNGATLTFTPLSQANMEPGTYVFNVEVRKVPNNTLLGIIEVTYDVVGNIVLPYPTRGHAFTLDRKFIEFTSSLNDAYYELMLYITAKDFYTHTPKNYHYPFKIPLFDQKQKFNIGLIVDRVMARMPDFIQEAGEPYRVASVTLDLHEKSFSDTEYDEHYIINDIRFVAGLQPEFKSGTGFLEIHTGASRVMPSGYYFINYVVKGFQQAQLYKNGEQIDYFAINEGIRTTKLDMASLGAAPGDVFEFRLITPEGNLSKFLKVFPEGYNSNMVIWENEYKLKTAMEFGGKYTVKSDIDSRTQLLYTDLVDVLTKIDSTKVSTLTINTGWILKSEKPAVESLMRAKRAVLITVSQVIHIVPVSKSIVNVDDSEALVSYDVEFQINRQYDEEIYSF
ncbi:hypothetical protein [Flavobacterium rhizosphaerae]|uniref:Uncharacterized protein n=1 Tax=Flavobacterium rhizosphaerae TaxID=3163298 RepID=A0ABW8YZG0_9FLAO